MRVSADGSSREVCGLACPARTGLSGPDANETLLGQWVQWAEEGEGASW